MNANNQIFKCFRWLLLCCLVTPYAWANNGTPVVAFDAFTKIEAEAYTSMSGLQTEACSDTGGGSDIGHADTGDYMVFNDVNFGSGTVKSLDFRIASEATFTGYAYLRTDSATGPIIATVPFGTTGGWQAWVTRSVAVTSVSGIKNIYITFSGSAASIGNINWLQFSTVDLAGTNAFNKIEAEAYNSMTGLQTEACSDTGGGSDVAWTDTGDYMVFNNLNFTSGAVKSLQMRVASGATFTGNAEIRLDSPTGTLIGTVPIGSTGGWQTWVTRQVPVSTITGTKNVYVVFTGGAGIGNINWLQFSTIDVSGPSFTKIEAESYNSTVGLATETSTDIGGGLNVGSSDENDYMVFNSINFGTIGSVKSVSFRMASAAAFTGYADVRVDSPTGTIIATVPFGNTGGWQNWITKKVSVSTVSGIKNVYIVLRGGNGIGNINWFQFGTDDITAPEVPATLAVSGANTQVVLSWIIAPQAVSYNIKRATVAGGPYTTLQSNYANNSYTDATVVNGTTYYYVVTAVNSKGESAASNQVSITPQVQVRVACIGDSITYGHGLDSTQTYPTQLGSQLGSGFVTFNFGVSGTTMLKNADSPYWNHSSYTNALNSNPGVVVIMLGTNDSKSWNWSTYGSQYIADYKAMIDAFNNLASKPKIYICLPAKAFSDAFAISEPNLANYIRPNVVQVANEKGISVIDIYDATLNQSANYQDGVHPTSTGAGVIAAKVKQIITTAQSNFTVSGATLTSVAGYGYQWFKDGVAIVGATAQTYNVSAAGKYKVLVKISNTNQDRIISNEQNVTGAFPPAAPVVTATAGNAQVSLSWPTVTGAASYTVKRSTSPTGTFTTLQGGLSATTYTNTGIANGITYYYAVSATNTNGTGTATIVRATGYAGNATIVCTNTYTITSKSSLKVLDMVGASTTNGVRVQLDNATTGNNNQKWKLTVNADGTYTITNQNSLKVMDVVDASTANNAQIQQWDNFTSANQKWQIENAGNGYVRIYAVAGGRMLDAGTAGTTGQLIFQNDGDGSDRQLWQLTAVSGARLAAPANEVTEVTVYPSPANTEFFIKSGTDQQIATVQLYNSNGSLVLESRDFYSKNSINVQQVPDGIYSIVMISGSGVVTNKRIVVMH